MFYKNLLKKLMSQLLRQLIIHQYSFLSLKTLKHQGDFLGLWKFNNSLRISIDYTTKLKEKLFKTYSENNPKGKYN